MSCVVAGFMWFRHDFPCWDVFLDLAEGDITWPRLLEDRVNALYRYIWHIYIYIHGMSLVWDKIWAIYGLYTTF